VLAALIGAAGADDRAAPNPEEVAPRLAKPDRWRKAAAALVNVVGNGLPPLLAVLAGTLVLLAAGLARRGRANCEPAPEQQAAENRRMS